MLKHKKSILYKSVDMMNDSIFTSENDVIITMWPKKKSDFQKNRYLSIFLSKESKMFTRCGQSRSIFRKQNRFSNK